MKTKLEIGKEYWLSAQKISRGIYLGKSNSGNFDFRITLGSKHTKPLGELDVMTSNLSVYSGYIPEKPWQFTTPIAMKCTEEQFNGIKDKLVEMGYEEVYMSNWDEGDYIVNNLMKHIGSLSNIFDVDANEFGRIMVDTFNPDLFLALAAMTDNEDGINGEWLTNGHILTKQDVGIFGNYSRGWHKATEQEIIEHFEKKEFLLQPRWYVELTESNRDIVIPWHKSIDKCSGRAYDIGAYYGIFESGTGDAWSSRELASQYQIITNDQFKKYVLKETTQSCQIIPIPPTKQATLFGDRVEITDWKPKDGEYCDEVYLHENGKFHYRHIKYESKYLDKFNSGLIKKNGEEADKVRTKLNQAML